MTRKETERRVAQRYAIGFRALASRATIDGAEAETVNISQTGVLARVRADVPGAGQVTVAIPGLEPRASNIVWRGEDLAGLQFVEPIDPATFAEFLAGSQERDGTVPFE